MRSEPTAVVLTTDWDGCSYPTVLRSEDFGSPSVAQLGAMPDGMMGKLLQMLECRRGQDVRCALLDGQSLGPTTLARHGDLLAQAWTFAFSPWLRSDLREFGDRMPVRSCCVVNLDRGEYVTVHRGQPSPLPFLLHVPPEHMRREGEGAWAFDSLLWGRTAPRSDDGFKDVSQVQPDP